MSESADISETYKGRTALKLGIPIVSLTFIDECAKQQKLVDSDEYLVIGKSALKQFSSGIIKGKDSVIVTKSWGVTASQMR